MDGSSYHVTRSRVRALIRAPCNWITARQWVGEIEAAIRQLEHISLNQVSLVCQGGRAKNARPWPKTALLVFDVGSLVGNVSIGRHKSLRSLSLRVAASFPPTGDSLRLKPWRLLAARSRTSCPNRDCNVVSFRSICPFSLPPTTSFIYQTKHFSAHDRSIRIENLCTWHDHQSSQTPPPWYVVRLHFSCIRLYSVDSRLASRASGSADSMAGSWFKFPSIARSSEHLIFKLLFYFIYTDSARLYLNTSARNSPNATVSDD